MKTVTLVSGGIDSVVMSKIIEKEGGTQFPLFIDYGQLCAEKEWSACKELMNKCKLPNPTKVDLKGYGQLMPCGITDASKDIYSDAFLPGRNLLFLTVGGAYAYYKKAKRVAIGLLSEKFHLFPDQTEKFVVNANFAINTALGQDIILVTPLINFNKKEVIKLAKKYEIPLEKTYSCHAGGNKYCGKCISCKEIISTNEENSFPQFGGL